MQVIFGLVTKQDFLGKKISTTSQYECREPRGNCTGPWPSQQHTKPPSFPLRRERTSAGAAGDGRSSLSEPVWSRGWRAQLQREHISVALSSAM